MRQTYARVDLGALSHNIQSLRQAIGPDCRLMAVVKADAYGHGLCQVAQRAERDGVDFLAVALVEEGLALREAGVTLPILVLSGLSRESSVQAVAARLTLTAHTIAHLNDINEAALRYGVKAQVHVKLDTGMNRIGVKDGEELQQFLTHLTSCEQIELTGAFTHFSCADDVTEDFTRMQLQKLNAFLPLLPPGLLLHTSGSSALLRFPEARFNMVRAGISMYGYSPIQTEVDLRPVLSWVAEITHVKTALPGETVSYGATVTLKRETRVATLAVGYGDGYNRGLSNKADVLINGRRCRVLGRVCMDQIMVDVTDAGETKAGEQAVLLGREGDETVTAAELADMLDTIPYEVLLNISKRVPRVYLD